jgi:hypothetical protein
LKQPLSDAPKLDVDVKGNDLAVDCGSVVIAGAVQILVAIAPAAAASFRSSKSDRVAGDSEFQIGD